MDWLYDINISNKWAKFTIETCTRIKNEFKKITSRLNSFDDKAFEDVNPNTLNISLFSQIS